MLVLADRNFPGYDLWSQAAATGADLIWRVGSIFPLPVVTVLADGSYLSRLSPPRKELRAGAAPIVVRVVEYHLLAADGTDSRRARTAPKLHAVSVEPDEAAAPRTAATARR